MMFFSYSDFGYELHLYSLQHLVATVVFLFLPVALLLIFKHRIMSSKNENYIRIWIGASGLALEFMQYGWYIFSGKITDWRYVIATTLCGLAVYLGSIAMITLNRKISPILYYLAYGAIFSFLFADISHGFNRFRFYGFFILHGLIIFNTVYLRVIHHFKYDRQAFIRTCKIMLPVLILSVVLNHLFDMNFFYMNYPLFEDFPVYTLLYETNRYLFSLAVFASYYILMYVMYQLARLAKWDKDPVRL